MSDQGEQRFTVQDEGIRRPAVDVARDIIREGDLRGVSAKHSTTILTRNVLQNLTDEIAELRSQLVKARNETIQECLNACSALREFYDKSALVVSVAAVDACAEDIGLLLSEEEST